MIDQTKKPNSWEDFGKELDTAVAGARAGAPEMRPGNVSLAQRRALARHGLAQQEQGQTVRTPAELSEIEKHKQYLDQIRMRMEEKKKQAEIKPLGDMPPINDTKLAVPELSDNSSGLDGVQSGTRELSFGGDSDTAPIVDDPVAAVPEPPATDPVVPDPVAEADKPLAAMADQVAEAPDTGEGVLETAVMADKSAMSLENALPAAVSTPASETVPTIPPPAIEPDVSPVVEQSAPEVTETVDAGKPEETVDQAGEVVEAVAAPAPIAPDETAAPLADDTTGSSAPPTQDAVVKRKSWFAGLLGKGKKSGGPTAADVSAVEKVMNE